MSGGSYNYICFKDAEDLFQSESAVQNMADRLAGLGYADDAANETQQLLLQMRQYRNRINASMVRLSGVWRSVEWWDSGDTSEDGVRLALAEYRKEDADLHRQT